MSVKITKVVRFDFDTVPLAGEQTQTYLQITVVNGIGDVGAQLRQKITRLNEKEQQELLRLLKQRWDAAL